ncbi:MAG TPA: hypothetical protein ACFYD6_01085 [Candidatus Brocadiia bacterium]|nr:hypothetical protein [Candidatus Brocadiales bacterium]
MGEEKKESKESKKMKYEQPRLVKLSGAKGAGDCFNGSGDISTCNLGSTASGEGCNAGNSPIPTTTTTTISTTTTTTTTGTTTTTIDDG